MSGQRICWLHHCFPQEREASADRSQFLSLSKIKKLNDRLVQISIQYGENLLRLGTLNRREMPPRFLKNRDSSFSQRRTLKILKREYQVEKPEADLREPQRQIQSTCLELATHPRSHEKNEQIYTKNCLYKMELYEKSSMEEFNKHNN